MVPQPLPYSAPPDPKLAFDPTATSHEDEPIEPLAFLRNTSGRPWKTAHKATVRTQKSDKSASNWDKRQEARKKADGVKKIEKCGPTALSLFRGELMRSRW